MRANELSALLKRIAKKSAVSASNPRLSCSRIAGSFGIARASASKRM